MLTVLTVINHPKPWTWYHIYHRGSNLICKNILNSTICQCHTTMDIHYNRGHPHLAVSAFFFTTQAWTVKVHNRRWIQVHAHPHPTHTHTHKIDYTAGQIGPEVGHKSYFGQLTLQWRPTTIAHKCSLSPKPYTIKQNCQYNFFSFFCPFDLPACGAWEAKLDIASALLWPK